MGADRRRVLVIEADRSVSRMMLSSLRAAGLDPVPVSTGADALQALDAIQVEAVVVDPDLPDYLGSQVLDRLREASESPRKQILWMVVSVRDPEHVTAYYGPIGDHFLAKPFDPWDLIDALRTLPG